MTLTTLQRSSVPDPPSGHATLYVDAGVAKVKLPDGTSVIVGPSEVGGGGGSAWFADATVVEGVLTIPSFDTRVVNVPFPVGTNELYMCRLYATGITAAGIVFGSEHAYGPVYRAADGTLNFQQFHNDRAFNAMGAIFSLVAMGLTSADVMQFVLSNDGNADLFTKYAIAISPASVVPFDIVLGGGGP